MIGQGAQRDIVDVHCHCFAGPAQADLVRSGLARLRAAGLSHLAVMGLANTRLDQDEIRRLIPAGFEHLGDPLFYEADDLLRFERDSEGMIFPLLDTRGLVGPLATQLEDFISRGFRGLKGLFLADDRNDLQVVSIPTVLGLSRGQYLEREWEMFDFARANSLPVVYHMDSRLYADEMRAILDDFPGLRIDFPHFGIGRKALGKIFDYYSDVYTDIAFMRPHIERDPSGYRDFILHYSDRVCFGSDALLYQPWIILEYIEMVRALQLPAALEISVFAENPRRFLGLPRVSP